MRTQAHGPPHAYVSLRKHIARAAKKADAGDWEEALASLDEARFAVQYLERHARLNSKQKAA